MYASMESYNGFREEQVTSTEHFSDSVDSSTELVEGHMIQGMGLGNQLFVIAATLAYAKQNQLTPWFKYCTNYVTRSAYWDSFLANMKPFLRQDTIVPHRSFREASLDFAPIPMHTDRIEGYFQSERYFKDDFTYIYESMGIKEQQDRIRDTCPWKDMEVPNVSMHFRLGDYKRAGLYMLTLTYYQLALAYLLERLPKFQVWTFYEAEDEAFIQNQLTTLRNQFPTVTFHSIPHLKKGWQDYEEMLAMSLCDHHIIANSSFSWWGAYLHLDAKKMVTYPRYWFANKPSCHDLGPESWMGIDG